MLFNDKLLFVHTPKTAGTSVTSFLIANLPRGVTLTEPPDRPDPSLPLSTTARLKLELRRLRRTLGLSLRASLKRIDGTRHESLQEAAEALAPLGRNLRDFEAIVAVIRNPYDLEVSRFHFFRRGHHGVKGLAHEYAEELALAGDFGAFARKAPYHGRLPGRIEDWYEIDGAMPPNLRLVRFETLEEDLYRIVGGLYPIGSKLPKLNATKHGPYAGYLTTEIEEAIYRKYRWLFDRQFYRRERM
ncbi:MAG TPA: hypothetical protein VII49_00340 [Rhizomicrobium sp.]